MSETGSALRCISTRWATQSDSATTLPWCGRWLRSVLNLVIPLANPDFEDRYALVCEWWIEVDSDGQPQREVGFDAAGDVIVASPLGDNLGFWTDSEQRFPPDAHPAVDPVGFDACWNVFADQFESMGAVSHRSGAL